MKKQSLWLDTAKVPDFPALNGTVKVDVLVVGAGITGITTAYLLKKAGCTVAVVDQHQVGGGETGHTTAHLTYVTDARLSEVARKLGTDRARAFWDAGREAMAQIVAIAHAEGIDCGLKAVPGYLFAALGKDTEKEKSALEEDARLAEELGFDAAMVNADPVFARPAIRFANQLKFHPLQYLFHLAKLIPGNGSHVFCGTSGSDIIAGKHELSTEHGTIHYDSLVAATHVPIQGERGTLDAALFKPSWRAIPLMPSRQAFLASTNRSSGIRTIPISTCASTNPRGDARSSSVGRTTKPVRRRTPSPAMDVWKLPSNPAFHPPGCGIAGRDRCGKLQTGSLTSVRWKADSSPPPDFLEMV